MKKFKIFFDADGGAAGGGEQTPPAGDGGEQTPPAGDGGEQTPPAGEGNPNPAELIKNGMQQTPESDGVPENYEFNLGEGLTISDEMKTQLTEIAKGANISQKTMDALLKMHSDVMLDTMRKAEDQVNSWAQDCAKQGLCTKENLALAKLAVDTFGGSGAMDILVQTGAANHPAVQKMLQTIGSLLKEDNAPDGSDPAPKQQNVADIIFGNKK